MSPITYVSYINTTPEKLWDALTSSASTVQYWFGRRIESQWRVGTPVTFFHDEGHGLDVSGEIIESIPGERLSYTWRIEASEALRREGFSRVRFELVPVASLVRLTVTHDELGTNERIHDGLRRGWPAIISNLKSLLETGVALPIPASECEA